MLDIIFPILGFILFIYGAKMFGKHINNTEKCIERLECKMENLEKICEGMQD